MHKLLIYIFLICVIFLELITLCWADIAKSSQPTWSDWLVELSKGAALIILGSLLAIFSEPLRQIFLGRFIRPRLEIFFEENNDDFKSSVPEAIFETIFEKINESFKQKTIETSRYKSIYVKAKVVNTKHYLAKSCRAFLVNVEKKVDGKFQKTQFSDSIQIEWSARGEEGFKALDLPFGISLFFVIFSTRETYPNKIKLHLRTMPFRYENLFEQIGIYRLKIMVSGDNATPIDYRLILDWRGKWDDFEVYPET